MTTYVRKFPWVSKGREHQAIVSFANFPGTLALKSILAKGCMHTKERALSQRTKQDDWPKENKDLEELSSYKRLNPPQRWIKMHCPLSLTKPSHVSIHTYSSLNKHSTYFIIFYLSVEILFQKGQEPGQLCSFRFNPWLGN